MKLLSHHITELAVVAGMGDEDKVFYSQLETLLQLKKGFEKSKETSWIRY